MSAIELTTNIKMLNIKNYPNMEPTPVTKKPNAIPQQMHAIRSAI